MKISTLIGLHAFTCVFTLIIVIPMMVLTMPFWFLHEIGKPILKYYASLYDELQEKLNHDRP